MRLNTNAVKELLDECSLTQSQLAKQIGISRSFLSNALSGRRGAGRKLLAGLLRAFPGETTASLTISLK